jgi:hypothetical protein
MRFFVIYTIDIPATEKITEYYPPQHRSKRWYISEEDDQYDYDYLGGNWEKGKHRKFCGELTKEEFTKFVDKIGLYAEDIETMGSLTMEYGYIPAISFNYEICYMDEPILSAYVTPFPELKRGITLPLDNRQWERIKKAVIRQYGY